MVYKQVYMILTRIRLGFCTAVLTNTYIRECMAIIKIDKKAFEHLKAFAIFVSEQEPELCVNSKTRKVLLQPTVRTRGRN